jgi:hypothetical protein
MHWLQWSSGKDATNEHDFPLGAKATGPSELPALYRRSLFVVAYPGGKTAAGT